MRVHRSCVHLELKRWHQQCIGVRPMTLGRNGAIASLFNRLFATTMQRAPPPLPLIIRVLNLPDYSRGRSVSSDRAVGNIKGALPDASRPALSSFGSSTAERFSRRIWCFLLSGLCVAGAEIWAWGGAGFSWTDGAGNQVRRLPFEISCVEGPLSACCSRVSF